MAQDEVTGQVLSTEQAERRTKAEERADRIVAYIESAAADIAAAIIERDWEALGITRDEWQARLLYGDRRLTPQARKTVHELLQAEGMGAKEIAPATGTPLRTVQRDLSPGVTQDGDDGPRHYGATPADQAGPSRSVTRPSGPKTPAERQADHRQRQREARTIPVTTTKTRRMPVTGDEWDEFNRELSELAVSRQDQELAQQVGQLTDEVARKDEFITRLLAENRALKAENEQLRRELKAHRPGRLVMPADPLASL